MSDLINTKFLIVSRPYISSQTKGCILHVQVGYTMFYFKLFSKKRDSAFVELHLFAPRQMQDEEGNTGYGYKCLGFFLSIGRLRFGNWGLYDLGSKYPLISMSKKK